MDVAFGIICVIFFLIVVLGPLLRRWFAPLLSRWAMGKMEDQMRRMAGMPTRKEERKAGRRAARESRDAAERFRRAAGAASARARRSYSRRPARSTVGLLRYVAEDVEFTEIRDYSHDSAIGARPEVPYRVEEQVEDVEFTEIRNKT